MYNDDTKLIEIILYPSISSIIHINKSMTESE